MIRLWLGLMILLAFLAGIIANPTTDGRHYSARVQQVRDLALDASRRIICDTPNGETVGTGFFIRSNRMITAAHVVSDGVCFIEGVGAARIVEINPGLDYALLQPVALFPGELSPATLRTTCHGNPQGQIVYTTGFARGQEFTILRGRFAEGPTQEMNRVTVLSIRGMSGGPVLEDNSDRVVGWIISISPGNNLTNIGDIALTSLCR